jgi:hypothetical protein
MAIATMTTEARKPTAAERADRVGRVREARELLEQSVGLADTIDFGLDFASGFMLDNVYNLDQSLREMAAYEFCEGDPGAYLWWLTRGSGDTVDELRAGNVISNEREPRLALDFDLEFARRYPDLDRRPAASPHDAGCRVKPDRQLDEDIKAALIEMVGARNAGKLGHAATT